MASLLEKPRNLATEIELHEQAKVALTLFKESDSDGSETLSFNELKELCNHAGLPMEADEEEMLMKMDTDDSGSLDIEEWTIWWLNRISTLPNPIKQQEAIAKNTFKKFDADGSGCLDVSELGSLTKALGADFSSEELADAVKEIDGDASGMIDISEFLAWWTNRAAGNRNNSSMISLKMRKLAQKASQVFSTDIFTAAWNGDLDLTNAFLQGEPRLAHACDSSEYGQGWSALHYACYQGHEELVRALLDAKAEVNRTTDLGFSPLFYAAQRGHLDICQLLMDKGADPSITGAQQLMAPLQQDTVPTAGAAARGAPDADGANDDADIGASNDNAGETVFMCPVEHMIDYPELRAIFKMSAKCTVPLMIPYDNVSASVSLAASLFALEVTIQQKLISQLPVKQWEVRLKMDMQMDTESVSAETYGDIVASGLSLNLRIPAVHPKQAQAVSAPLARSWVKKLHFLCTLHKMKRLELLEASLAGLTGLWTELSSMYASIDPLYQKALNISDFLMNIVKSSPDRSGSMELQQNLIDALEYVVANYIAPTYQLLKISTAAARKSESKDGDGETEIAMKAALALNEPVFRINTAIREVLSKKLIIAAAAATAAASATLIPIAPPKQPHAIGKNTTTSTAGSVGKSKHQQAKESKDVQHVQSPPPAVAAVTAPELAVKWRLGDSTVKPPTVALSIAALNDWGTGAFSSSCSVTVLLGKSRQDRDK